LKTNFEADDVVWLASGDMLDVCHAVIWALASHRLLCCYQMPAPQNIASNTTFNMVCVPSVFIVTSA
jgi:hypothetical protein